jgi:endonuclease/exonuclease/phosphatase family metal-dependent hydrolase
VRTHCLRDTHHHAAYGNAILTRLPILAEEHFNLSYNKTLEPRGCLHVTVDTGLKPLHVFCVHLGLRYRERHYQVDRLLSDEVVNSPKFGTGPKVLMGDFNNWWPVKSAQKIHPHFENACVVTGRHRHGTFNKYWDVLCLDYIFASRDLKVEAFEVVKDGIAKVASDHRPVICSLSIPVNGSTSA